MKTKIVIRQGKDFINIFYEIPEGLRDHYGGHEYVASLDVTLYVEGQPFEAWHIVKNTYFGRFYEKLLAPGEYSYKIVEKVLKKDPGTRQTESEVNEISESFTI